MQDVRTLLPDGWDLGRDLVVLVGRGGEALGGALAGAGQERLLVLLPREAPATGLPERARVLRSAQELLLAVQDFPGVAPEKVSLHSTSDPWATRERLEEAARAVGDALHAKRLVATTIAVHGSEWLRQGLANLDWIARAPSVAALDDAFRGKPCVIVSPGPSLSKNLHLLPGLEERALLVAGTHGLAALQRAGARPHLVVAADPGDLDWHLDGLDLEGVEAFLIGATCRRSNFERPVRRRFTFASNGAIDDWIFDALGEDARVPSGGSVACSSLGLALRLGCDPIVLVGQDLSFPAGRAYAAETKDGAARLARNDDGSFFLKKPEGELGPGDALAGGGLRVTRDQRMLEVPALGGGTVPTSETFYTYLRWFEAMAAEHAGRVRLVNCTEGGALIAGMEHRPLAELAAGWTEPLGDVGAALDAAATRLDLARRRKLLARHAADMQAALDPCLALATRCERLASRAASDPKALERLGSAEKELSRALRPLRLVSLLAQDEIQAAQDQARRATDLATNLAAARRLFAVVSRTAGTLRDPVRNARAALAAGS